MAADKDSAEREDMTIAAENPPAEPVKAAPPRGSALSDEDRHDLDTPTGTAVTYSKAAVTVTAPKTNTEIGIHGFAQFQIIHDTDGLDNNEFDRPRGDGSSADIHENVRPPASSATREA